MEAERQKFETHVYGDKGDHRVVEKAVGPVEKFEFGVPGDEMSRVIGGGYMSHWNVDFLQRELGKEGTCSRFYYDKKMVVDIGDPETVLAKRKRKLLFRHGFGYLCIPSNFPQDEKRLRKLYQAALEEYFNYEKLHPRPAVLQETTIIDEKGQVRRAFVTAIDVRVGGGMIGSVAEQTREMQRAQKLSPREVRGLKLQARLHRKLRRAVQTGTPFRNPFVAKNKRLYPVQYAQ